MTEDTKAVKTLADTIAKVVDNITQGMREDIKNMQMKINETQGNTYNSTRNYYTRTEADAIFVDNDELGELRDDIASVKQDTTAIRSDVDDIGYYLPTAKSDILTAINEVKAQINGLGCAGGGSANNNHTIVSAPCLGVEIETETIVSNMYMTLEYEDELPISIITTRNALLDYTIYGNTGGVGDYDSNANKYKIPVNVRGKNLLYMDFNTKTNNGITFTPNSSNGTIVLSGTATNDASCVVNDNATSFQTTTNYITIPSGTYANNYNSGTITVTYYLIDGNDNVTQNTNASFTVSGSTKIVAIITVPSGTVCDNIVISPQLEVGSTSTAFEKYFNNTANIYVDIPLTEGESVSYNDVFVSIPTIIGTNKITIGTQIQPTKMFVKYIR